MVQKVEILSSKELFDNKNDDLRVYDISANVQISSSKVRSMENGNVYKAGEHVAEFSSWEQNHLNMTYRGVGAEEQNIINSAVNAFISEVKENVNL